MAKSRKRLRALDRLERLDKPGFVDEWLRLRVIFSRRGLKALAKALYAGFAENRLLTYASAIGYQVLFALVPLLLAGLALLGFLNLESVWQQELAPRISEQMSEAAFEVVDNTVERILTEQRGFWLTLGVALALWEVSGAIRGVMEALNGVYDTSENRAFWKRFGLSFLLALTVSASLGLALTALHFAPTILSLLGDNYLVDVFGQVVRWGLTLLPLYVAIGLIVRYAPARQERSPWFGLGATLAVLGWVGSSLVFGWYLQNIARYQSIFGGLAVVIVLMTYLYISVIAFLVGVQLDAIVRKQAQPGDVVVPLEPEDQS